MSINKYQAVNGVVLFQGERLIIFYDGCELKFTGGDSPLFKGNNKGRIYLTSHRLIFNSTKASLKSFSMPLVNMRNVDIKQPVFGANKIVGKVLAEPDGGFTGSVGFDITFTRGGAIEVGQALLELGKRATQARNNFVAPQTTAPLGSEYYACPPPAYAPPYQDPYYGFVPQHDAFGVPPNNTLYQYAAPPPYPGAVPVFTGNNPEVQPWPTTGQMTTPYPMAPPAYSYASPPPMGTPYAQPGPPNASGAANGTIPAPTHNNINSINQQMPFNAGMVNGNSAKAAEAAASGTQGAGGAYYFPEQPHTIYTAPSAPPYSAPNDNKEENKKDK